MRIASNSTGRNFRLALTEHPINDKAYDSRKQQTDRRGKSHRSERLGEIFGGKSCSRNAKEDDGKGVVDKRNKGKPAGAEISAETEMHCSDEGKNDARFNVFPRILYLPICLFF